MRWYEADTFEVTNDWLDAPVENIELLDMIFDVARQQVMAFAEQGEEPVEEVTDLLERLGFPRFTIQDVLALLALPPTPDPPSRYVYAQLQQAKNLWNAGRVSSDGSVGAEGFAFVPRPLDRTIRSIIRPQSGAANVL